VESPVPARGRALRHGTGSGSGRSGAAGRGQRDGKGLGERSLFLLLSGTPALSADPLEADGGRRSRRVPTRVSAGSAPVMELAADATRAT
jgi:hypothetical protein